MVTRCIALSQMTALYSSTDGQGRQRPIAFAA
jgi:hypothetical protein